MTANAADLPIELIRTQQTMVLATAAPQPWAAPVYYVYQTQRFYFFSSTKSRHINATAEGGRCAAAIFRDGNSWREIEGLQMEGRVARIQLGAEALSAYSNYVKKFPTVKDFFAGEVFGFSQFIERFHTQLYAFLPEQVYYLNNQAGLSKRLPIELPKS